MNEGKANQIFHRNNVLKFEIVKYRQIPGAVSIHQHHTFLNTIGGADCR